jgi:lysozyme
MKTLGKSIYMNKIAIDLIKESEGCKLTAYWDKTGKTWTVGYGATGPKICKLTQWSQAYAEHDLEQRINKLIDKLITASPVLKTASPSQQAALVSFVYNGGMGMYTNHSLKPFVDAQDWVGAAKEIKLFHYSGGVSLPGLVTRRNREAGLLLCLT